MNADHRFDPEPNPNLAPERDPNGLPDWLTDLARKLRRTQLMPLDSPSLKENGHSCESEANRASFFGKLTSQHHEVPFELSAGPKPGTRRLRINGQLPNSGSPLALLIGPAMNFFTGKATGEPAAKRLSFDAIAPAAHSASIQFREERDEFSEKLAADDDTNCDGAVVDPQTGMPGARSDALEWFYDVDNDTFELKVNAPAHMPCVPVAIDLRSAEDSDIRELHVEVVAGPRSSTGQLLKSIVELGPAALGRQVDVVIEPIRPDNPDHVQAFLAETVEQFVTLPLRPEADGSFLVDFRWPDEKAAAANRLAGWALMIAVEQEVG